MAIGSEVLAYRAGSIGHVVHSHVVDAASVPMGTLRPNGHILIGRSPVVGREWSSFAGADLAAIGSLARRADGGPQNRPIGSTNVVGQFAFASHLIYVVGRVFSLFGIRGQGIRFAPLYKASYELKCRAAWRFVGTPSPPCQSPRRSPTSLRF